MSIAFLFLTYDEVEREDIWKKYFETADTELYHIYVHPKTPNKIWSQSIFKDCLLEKTVETQWGGWSLIEAQKRLLEEALKNLNHQHFILVSQNTIPINTFDELYIYMKDKPSLFYYKVATHPQHYPRYHGIKEPCFTHSEFLFASQWSILSRKHAELLVEEHVMIKYHYGDMAIPDEHAYINYLIYHKKESIMNKMMTYFQLDPLNYDRPVIFSFLPSNYIKVLQENKYFFLRKVTPTAFIQFDIVK